VSQADLAPRALGTRGLAVAAIPVAVTLAIFFAKTHLFPIRGDEPHYVMMAFSLLNDHDLDLKNNYESGYYPRLTPHVQIFPRGWMPYHGVGLSFLVAPALAIGGEGAIRVALVLFTGLLPWAVFRWLAPMLGFALASWTIVGLMLCVPIAFGSTQIYPDLPGGVLAMALTCWFLIRTREQGPTRAWPLFWLLSGLLPWLNAKFAPAVIVFASAGGCFIWRLMAAGRRSEARAAAWAMPLIAVGPVLLAAFNLWAYGTVFGVRRLAELTRSSARASMMFLGLHLDQSQGMFLCQPLLLAGVMALVPFVRQRPRVALFCGALYLSLIVPNSMQLARYGLGGPADRFAWSAMWLWIVPLGFALASYKSSVERFVRPAVLAAVLYQVAIAPRWIEAPEVLFTRVIGPRDSLFPSGFERWLPSFYTWDFVSYLYNPVNQLAFATIVLLMAIGARAASTPRRPGSHAQRDAWPAR
jgi:hypothetical protein